LIGAFLKIFVESCITISDRSSFVCFLIFICVLVINHAFGDSYYVKSADMIINIF